jgi:hypothetical protein
VRIDLLSCNLDEIQVTLLREIEQSLISHRILPVNSSRIKQLFSNEKISIVSNILFAKEGYSYSNALKAFKEELKKMGKKLVIVYEDIDRISNVDIIKKIFSITESLSGELVKVIYQFDSDKLISLGIDREYMDKYLSFIVNLSPIGLKEAIENIFDCEDLVLAVINVNDLKYLYENIHLNYYLEKKLNLRSNLAISMENASIRTLINFIIEADILLSENTDFQNDENRKTIITFTFVKYFYPHIYKEFTIDKGLLDTFKFQYNGEDYSIFDLISKNEQADESDKCEKTEKIDTTILLENTINRDKLALLSLFGYELDIYNASNVEAMKERDIKNSSSNEKKDRLIWNLLCRGKSEYTNNENAVKKFITEVLNINSDLQNEAYLRYCNDMFNERYEKKDNDTIFNYSESNFISLAQSFVACNIDNKNWIKFIEFYTKNTQKNTLDLEVLQILLYAPLCDKNMFIHLIRIFSSMDIIGNMNTSKIFYRFIVKYFRGLSSFGYTNTRELEIIVDNNEELIIVEYFDRYTMVIISRMKLLKRIINIEVINDELELLIKFLEKCIEIVLTEDVIEKREPRVTTSYSSSYKNQDEFDRLNSLKDTVDAKSFSNAILNSYNNNRISAYEIAKLLSPNSDRIS